MVNPIALEKKKCIFNRRVFLKFVVKILLIVDKFKGRIPTGIISQRIADELISLGNEVVVVSAYNQGEGWTNGEIYRCRKIRHIFLPRFRLIVSNFFQMNFDSFKWRRAMFELTMHIIEKYRPDVIYARSTPISVCEISAKLSLKTGIPSLMHFTDPVPAPIEWDGNILYRRRMIKTVNKILQVAKKVSFGNAAMLDYVQSLSKYDFKNKAFVSPDPVPTSNFYYTPPTNRSEVYVVYLGSLYGNRNPKPLIDALDRLNNEGLKIKFEIYDINRVGTILPSFARFVGRTDNVKCALLASNILIDLDGDDTPPVFISSKIKEYLCCGRPILSITPDNSPSHQMTKSLRTVFHSINETREIEKAIRFILSSSFQESDYEERLTLIQKHTPKVVAEKINEELQSMVK